MNWILTKNKLPEKEGSYLVTRESCDEVSVMNFDADEKIFYQFNYSHAISEAYEDIDYASDVIAWLPFPEPYREPKMIKVVINGCFGGFGLSSEAYDFLEIPWDGFGFAYMNDRTNPKLIECIETLGKKANGRCANLIIVEVPDNIDWYIDEYDGSESIEEVHNSWC